MILQGSITFTNVFDGATGETLYTWIAYADDEQGNGFALYPSGKKYIGVAYNKTTPLQSLDPSDYTWSKYVGEEPITVTITSSGGNIFKNGKGSSILTAKVYKGSTEIDTDGTMYNYTWTKKDNGVTSTWTTTGKEITVNQNHVDGITVFTVKVGEVAQGQYTIADLADVIVSATPPLNPVVGTIWFDTTTNKTYIWTGREWANTVSSDVIGGANKIRNSRFNNDEYKYWIEHSGIKIDNELRTPNGYNSVVSEQREFTYDINRGIETDTSLYKIHCKAGQQICGQVKMYIPQEHGIDRGVKLVIGFYNPSGILIGEAEQFADVNLTNMWQHIKIENLVAPNNTDYITLNACVVRNGKCWFGEPMIEFGTVCTDFRPSTEDIKEEADGLVDRVVHIEDTITGEGLISTIISSESVKNILDGKADIKDLEGIMSKEEIEDLLEQYKNYMDGVIGGIDLTDYIQRSDFERTMREFLFSFKQGGGVNLIRDSIGFSETHEWWTMNKVVALRGNPQMDAIGFPSGWLFSGAEGGNDQIELTKAIAGISQAGRCIAYSEDTLIGGGGNIGGDTPTPPTTPNFMVINESKIGNCILCTSTGEATPIMLTEEYSEVSSDNIPRLSQTIKVNPNKEYTIGFYITKPMNTGSFRVYVRDTKDNKPIIATMVLPSTSEYKMEYVFWTFKVEVGEVEVIFESNSTSNVMITGLMMNQGGIPLNWQSHPEELYNSNVKFDINGITVNRLDKYGKKIGYTAMTPTEFAGYYIDPISGEMIKVFWLEKDSTYTKKVIVKEEINLGTIKMVQVNGKGNTGIAFVGMSEPVK